jgi:hypothetical protein
VIAPGQIHLLEALSRTEVEHALAAPRRVGVELGRDGVESLGGTHRRAGDDAHPRVRRMARDGVAGLREPEMHAGVEDLIRDGVPAVPEHELARRRAIGLSHPLAARARAGARSSA